MSEIDDKLKEISDKINEHIITVKGTLELLDASVSEDDLRNLILKAIKEWRICRACPMNCSWC
jgi:hypothetical protein